MDEVRGREVAARMGIKIMGTIGVLGTAFEEKIISKSEIKNAIEILRNSGRHISERLYEQLLNFIESSNNARHDFAKVPRKLPTISILAIGRQCSADSLVEFYWHALTTCPTACAHSCGRLTQ